jgi:hypothetical protein
MQFRLADTIAMGMMFIPLRFKSVHNETTAGGFQK